MPVGWPPSADRDLIGRDGSAIVRLGWHGRVAPTTSFHAFRRLPHIFQNSILVTLDQLIKQPQHGLNHPRMGRILPRLAECFNGIVHRRGDIMPVGYPPRATVTLSGGTVLPLFVSVGMDGSPLHHHSAPSTAFLTSFKISPPSHLTNSSNNLSTDLTTPACGAILRAFWNVSIAC